jgi:hypothetical protein
MKKTKTTKPTKPYWEMTAKELADATKEFDGPLDLSKWRPITKAERAKFERMQKQGSKSIHIKRPSIKEVTVRLDAALLRQCSEYAAKHDLTLSDVITKSLQSEIASAK